MCLLDKITCSSLVVVACILTRIFATLLLNRINTFSRQRENNPPISFQNLCEDISEGYCLNGGDCYNVNRGATRENFRWLKWNTEPNKASIYCQEKEGTSGIFVFLSENATKKFFDFWKRKSCWIFLIVRSGKMKKKGKSDLTTFFFVARICYSFKRID